MKYNFWEVFFDDIDNFDIRVFVILRNGFDLGSNFDR